MTPQEFEKKILRVNWYDKYLYYLLFLAAAFGGLFFLYDVIFHQGKYNKFGANYGGYLPFLFLTGLGISGLFYFVPNRYKIISIASSLPINNKMEIIDKVVKEFGDPFCSIEEDFYSFNYHKNWWTSNYKIYLSFDLDNFYASVIGTTRGSRGDIIDFGGANKVRRKLITYLSEAV